MFSFSLSVLDRDVIVSGQNEEKPPERVVDLLGPGASPKKAPNRFHAVGEDSYGPQRNSWKDMLDFTIKQHPGAI